LTWSGRDGRAHGGGREGHGSLGGGCHGSVIGKSIKGASLEKYLRVQINQRKEGDARNEGVFVGKKCQRRGRRLFLRGGDEAGKRSLDTCVERVLVGALLF
jgi:hypothetical protein